MKTNKKPMNGKNGVKFDHDQLAMALRDGEDLLDRCLISPPLVLDETADSVFNDKDLYGGRVVFGVEKKQLTHEVVSTLKVYLKKFVDPEKIDEELAKVQGIPAKIVYEAEGVPVIIKILRRKYRFLKFKDSRIYTKAWSGKIRGDGKNSEGEYHIPNPFEEYWKIRKLVQ